MNSKYADCLTTFKNSKADEIPSYPSQTINHAYQQVNQCYNQLKQLNKRSRTDTELSQDQKIFLKGKMVIKIDNIYRLKRFLLIAHENRCKRIEDQFWQFGGQVRKSELTNLDEKQKKYLLEYKKLINNYIEDIGLQLTMDLQPPIDPVIQVKVLKDCGEIVQEGLKLQKNTVFHIRKKLVQKFIQRGDVIQLVRQ